MFNHFLYLGDCPSCAVTNPEDIMVTDFAIPFAICGSDNICEVDLKISQALFEFKR